MPILDDELYMWRCLHLAQIGKGHTAPNPMVGSVVVCDGRVLGEAWHTQYGKAHAEREAIARISPADLPLLPRATIYVNLEPCAHYGKTPPCADYIIECGIRRVVVACTDPFAQVAGRGIARLQQAGIEVITGVLEREAQWLNRRFMVFQQYRRPYIILKWAQTADGYFAPTDASQRWISNPDTQVLCHRWRSEEAAVMVATRTAQADNPQLNVRHWQGSKMPVRVAIDRRYTLPPHLHLLDGTQPTLIFGEQGFEPSHPHLSKPHPLRYISLTPAPDLLPQIWQQLYDLQLQSVLVEGGANLLNQLIANHVWDEARVFTAPTSWHEGIHAPLLPPQQAQLIQQQYLGDNLYSHYINTTFHPKATTAFLE